jgi:hypothetical protein
MKRRQCNVTNTWFSQTNHLSWITAVTRSSNRSITIGWFVRKTHPKGGQSDFQIFEEERIEGSWATQSLLSKVRVTKVAEWSNLPDNPSSSCCTNPQIRWLRESPGFCLLIKGLLGVCLVMVPYLVCENANLRWFTSDSSTWLLLLSCLVRLWLENFDINCIRVIFYEYQRGSFRLAATTTALVLHSALRDSTKAGLARNLLWCFLRSKGCVWFERLYNL